MRIGGLELDVCADGVAWKETRERGVRWLPLGPRGADGDDVAALIEMAPGCSYPAHRHRGAEDVLVLAGGYRDERGEHVAGTYLRYEPGSAHHPVALGDPNRPVGPANPACVLYAVARAGVELLDCDDGS